jgi:hypothetical protein
MANDFILQRILNTARAHGFAACFNNKMTKVKIFIPYTHPKGDGVEEYVVETLEEMYLALGY